MSLSYVSPTQMAEYRKQITLYSKGAASVKCIRSHFFADASGVCDLTKSKGHEEIFVLSNRAGEKIKVSRQGIQIVANVVDIEDADQWYENLKEQKKKHREHVLEETEKREQQRLAASKNVLLRKKKLNTNLLDG